MKKVCICGTSRTLKQIPQNIPGLEYWILNDMYLIAKGFSRVFEIHPKDILDNCISSNGNMRISELAKLSVPVYMQEHFEDVPNSIKYPLDDIIQHFGRDVFQSTVDYMIALALYEGYEEIYIYGVDMSVGEEYEYQKPTASYWIGRAEGMGVKVFMPDNCDLLKTYYRYGYEDLAKDNFIIKAQAQIKELDRQSKEFNKNYYIAQGAKETWEFILRATQKG